MNLGSHSIKKHRSMNLATTAEYHETKMLLLSLLFSYSVDLYPDSDVIIVSGKGSLCTLGKD
ncbi:MAG: hypothetical protein ACI9JM_001243 [Halioglobus sp.]|jgi:hypothetical protein